MARQAHVLLSDEPMTTLPFTRSLFFRSVLLAIFLLIALGVVGAKSIKMVTSWFNPKYQGQTFHKILVIGVAQNLEVRADF